MLYSMAPILASIIVSLAYLPLVQGEDSAPESDRKLVASLILKALVPEAERFKVNESASERHRVVVGEGPLRIVTFWRSEISATASMVAPDRNLKVEVPTLVRAKAGATLTVKAEGSVEGEVSGKALTDGGQQILSIRSKYRCRLQANADVIVNRKTQDDKVTYQIEIKKWDPSLSNLEFEGALKQLQGPIESLANEKIKAESGKLRDAMNRELQKAYEEGRLTLPE